MPHKVPSLAILSLCNIKGIFHFIYNLLLSTGWCWYITRGGWCMPSCSAQSDALSSLLIAIQNSHEYFMLWRSHQIPQFLRRLSEGETHQSRRDEGVSSTSREKALKGNTWKRKKAELFDPRGDGKSRQMQRSRLTVAASRPWPGGGPPYLMGLVSMQPCVLPERRLISAMTHSPPPPLAGPRNPLNPLKSNLSSLTAHMIIHPFSIHNNNISARCLQGPQAWTHPDSTKQFWKNCARLF